MPVKIEKPESEWKPLALLPNIEMKDPVVGGYIALVGTDDERIQSMRKEKQNFSTLLSCFKDTFGNAVNPSVLIRRADAPPWLLSMEAIASFRDIVAISTVIHSRTSQINYKRSQVIGFANWFSLYPWMSDRDDKYIIANTPAMLALHKVKHFRGQCSPELSPQKLSTFHYDDVLMKTLISRWHRRYSKKSPIWKDRALFRSLNMSYQAAMMPAGQDAILYDVGRMIALWVSAFEILAHPGDGKSNFREVYSILDSVEYEYRAAAARLYKLHPKSENRRGIAACWIYGKLHQTRNDFIHGAPVRYSQLRLPGTSNLFQIAAPLYRLALTGFLPLRASDIPLPNVEDAEVFGSACAQRWAICSGQKEAERAIILSRGVDFSSNQNRGWRRSPKWNANFGGES